MCWFRKLLEGFRKSPLTICWGKVYNYIPILHVSAQNTGTLYRQENKINVCEIKEAGRCRTGLGFQCKRIAEEIQGESLEVLAIRRRLL